MKKIINKIKDFGVFETIVLIIFTILMFILVITHECYQEEAQSWLMARDLNPIQLIQQLKYEGHSFLWYYILMPFAKMGFPMKTQNFITAIMAIAGVYLILKKSPFSKAEKLLMVFSGGMIYFYGVIARPYALAVLILYAIAAMYSQRKEHPYKYAILLAILGQTHLIMVPVVVMLAIFFWGSELIKKETTKEEKIELLKSLSIVVVSLIMFFIICIFTVQNCAIIRPKETNLTGIWKKIRDQVTVTTSYLIGSDNVKTYHICIVAIAIVMCIIGSIKNTKLALVFWAQVIFTFLVHAFVWNTISLRVYMVIYMLIFWMWLYKNEYKKDNKWLQIAFIIFFLITAVPSYSIAIQDIFYNYSDGENAAKYIENNIEEGACFVCVDNETQQSIIGHLPKDKYKFYQVSSQSYFTYMTWSSEWNRFTTYGDAEDIIKKFKNDYENLYVISLYFIGGTDMKLVYTPDEKIINHMYNQNGREKYYIYKIVK